MVGASRQTIPREKLTCQNREGGGDKINLHALANTVHWIDRSSDWYGFGWLIASSQSKSYRNIHFPGLPCGYF